MPPVPLRSGLSWVFRNLAEDHGAHTLPAEMFFTGAVRTFLHLRDRSHAQRHKGLRIVEGASTHTTTTLSNVFVSGCLATARPPGGGARGS